MKWEALVTPSSVSLSEGENKLSFRPAEIDKITSLISSALGMESLKALPEYITNTPFVIKFWEDNSLSLEAQDRKGRLPFQWDEADELIRCFHNALKSAIDERTLRPGARGGFVDFGEGEPFI